MPSCVLCYGRAVSRSTQTQIVPAIDGAFRVIEAPFHPLAIRPRERLLPRGWLVRLAILLMLAEAANYFLLSSQGVWTGPW
jgi:hypothetical protein